MRRVPTAIDGRLLMPAAAVWGAAAVARVGPLSTASLAGRHEMAVALARGSLVLLAVSGLVLLAASATRRDRLILAVTVTVAAGSLGVLTAGLEAAATTAPPVAAWIDARATATVQGVITSEPRARRPRGAPTWSDAGSTEVRLATSRVGARGSVVDVDLPLLVRLPPGTRPPPPGSRVTVSGRLGAVPWPADVAAAVTARTIVVLDGPGPVDRAAHGMRTALRAALATSPPDAGSLVAGLAVGDEAQQSAELASDMRRTGLSHLTAVSGGNVAIVLAAILVVGAAVRLTLWLRVVVALAGLAFFAILVGPQPSVLRATAMGAIAVVGLVVGGRRAGPSVLAAGVIVLVVLSPALATSWGFALSALATAGLILLTPALADRLAGWPSTRRLPPAIRGALALTAAAQVATLPILVAMGGATGWVSFPANLLVMPVVPPVTILGLLAAVAAPVSLPVGTLLARAAAWPARWIATVAHAGADLPLTTVPWPTGWTGLATLAGAVVVLAGLVRLWRRWCPRGLSPPMRLAVAVLLAVVVAVGVVRPPNGRGWPPPGWFLIMCDVGQGDALLLRAAAAAAVVVDAGPDPDLIDGCLDDAGVTSVPAIVLTHFHSDHVDGLSGVFRGRAVGVVLTNPIREPAGEALLVDQALAGTGRSAQPITSGDSRRAGSVSWRALWPRRRIGAGSVPNNASTVLEVTVSGHRVLLTGDIEPEAQAAIAADLTGAVFDVVKVPHHGSRFQLPTLPQRAPARVALVSVGVDNDYGHPAPETLAAWRATGALVARTDRDGDVAVVDGPSGLGVVTRRGMLPPS